MKLLCIIILLFLFSESVSGQTDTSSFDPLMLQEVIITDYNHDEKLKVPVSLSTIPRPADAQLQGVASLMSDIPGIFADASVGEVFTRVFARGISLSAEDDIGWYYMSLQEDGLPITAVQFNQFSPDFFLRPDVSHNRLEVLKGGKSSILAPSGPGGIVNFISEKTPNLYSTHDRLTTGFHSSGRPYVRVEGFSGGPMGNSAWSYDFSYLYRFDKGPRKVDYSFNNGGQVKLGIQKNLKNGILSFKFKWLDDKVNRYSGLPATNWNDPQPAIGLNFQQNTLLPPSLEGQLPNPRGGPDLTYNPANGIKAKEISATVALDIELGEWRLTDKLKYSAKSLNWQTAIGGQPLGLENFLTYFISGDPFPIGNVRFTDVRSGQPLATVNNQGAFAVFQGLPASFEYVSGSLPNDAIMGSGTWYKDDQINEWMNQLLLQRQFESIDVNLGLFFAHSKVDVFTDASFLFATYEPEPKLLSVVLDGLDGSERLLSDEFGLSNYGGLFYEAANITASQIGISGDADILLTKNLAMNTGFRYERIRHSGTRDRSAPKSLGEGGLDGNPLTTFDNGILTRSGDDQIDATYNYLNYSVALDYQFDSNTSTFIRYTLGHKAPELNYYINNFTNQEIPSEEAPVQSIRQLELGIKRVSRATSFTATAFLSKLKNVAYSNFIFDDQENRIFYTPTQFNSSNTLGIELEFAQLITERLSFRANATLQNPKMSSFTLYNANETIDVSDDRLMDFSDNHLPHNPKIIINSGFNYNHKDWSGGFRINHMGSRYGNLENAVKLPSYRTVDVDMGYALSTSFAIGLRVKNVFNSAGIANFFGPNSFGSNSDAASAQFINSNPNASFVVFPIMPRAIYLSVDYTFSKE